MQAPRACKGAPRLFFHTSRVADIEAEPAVEKSRAEKA